MKEGFFPNLERKGNIRYFSDNELEALRIIECLKKSGLEIKDIKQFFIWVSVAGVKWLLMQLHWIKNKSNRCFYHV